MGTNEILAIALAALKKGGGGGGGTSNYNNLSNLPKINGVTLQGDKTSADLHISDLSELIGADFDDTKAYSVGDIVIYEDSLYRFIQDHAAGAWDDNDVESVTVVDLIYERPAVVVISQADYDLLSYAEKHDLTKMYFLYDGGSGGGGTDDYNDLENKPQINSVTLQGNKSFDDLNIGDAIDLNESQLNDLLDRI